MACAVAAAARAGNASDTGRRYPDAFAQAQTPAGPVPADGSARDDYANYFFLGFRHASGGMSIPSPLLKTAYARGEVFWHEHPAERAQVFAAHGYVPVERTGAWSRGFEREAFETGDGEIWWMDTATGGSWADTGLVPAGRRTHVHIVGYLSPKGQYGHMGGYEREVLVTSGERIEPGQR